MAIATAVVLLDYPPPLVDHDEAAAAFKAQREG